MADDDDTQEVQDPREDADLALAEREVAAPQQQRPVFQPAQASDQTTPPSRPVFQPSDQSAGGQQGPSRPIFQPAAPQSQAEAAAQQQAWQYASAGGGAPR